MCFLLWRRLRLERRRDLRLPPWVFQMFPPKMEAIDLLRDLVDLRRDRRLRPPDSENMFVYDMGGEKKSRDPKYISFECNLMCLNV